jgi:hypothetical protein
MIFKDIVNFTTGTAVYLIFAAEVYSVGGQEEEDVIPSWILFVPVCTPRTLFVLSQTIRACLFTSLYVGL